MALRPLRLRTVFLATSVAILLLPLGGVVLLRLYESALIRRTEAELLAQGALAAAVYRDALATELGRPSGDGEPGSPAPFGVPADPGLAPVPSDGDRFSPLPAQLDLAVDPVLPPPAAALPAPRRPDDPALAAGARLTPLLVETQRITLAGLRLLDPAGVVVASSGSELGLSLAHRDEVRRALAGEPVRCLREREMDHPHPPLDSISRSARLRVWVAIPVRDGDRVWGVVLLSRTPMSVTQSLWGIRGWLAAGAVALLAVVILLTALTSLTVTRPVAELIRRTERVAAGDSDAARPLERPGTDELARLSEAFAHMARTLDARATYITGFAASVSHEFKTPLASMRGTVEILRDHLAEMTAAERDRFLANLEADVVRLERLVRGQVDLARADVLRPGAARSELAPVLERLAEKGRADGARVELAPDAAGMALSARISTEALEAVLANLLDNARRHGGPGVSIALRARDEPLEGRPGVVIEVADDGPGISEANLARVFEPFFTTARGQGGTGLGLAVVRSLLRAHGGTIGVRSRPGETVFRAWIPR